MRDTVVKGSEDDLLHVPEGAGITEIVPEAQGNPGKLQPASSAAEIRHGIITILRCCIHGGPSLKMLHYNMVKRVHTIEIWIVKG